MKTKRVRPILFPNHTIKNSAPSIPVKAHQVAVGANFRIGNPTNVSYMFLWNSLKQKLNYLHKPNLPSSYMVDQVVTITGILKRDNNTYTAILERMDKGEFYEGLRKIYADINNAVKAKELITL